MSDNDLQHVRETAFHMPRTTLHLVSEPSKELCTKTPGTHFPENPIFLSSSSDADTEQVTAGNKEDVKGQKKSSPRSIIFLYSSGDADIEQETAGYKGHVRRPEEVISQINHIFLYSSGQLPRRSPARRKYQIFKCEQRLYRNFQEVVSRFAHTQLCLAVKTTHQLVAEGREETPEIQGNSRP